MKKQIIISLVAILFCFNCKAQNPPLPQIIPVEENIDYINNDVDIPDGVYFKDINHVLDKYISTWIGNYNDKTFEVHVIEFTDNFLGVTEDMLLMRYKITDANGDIVENTLTLAASSPYVVKGRYLSANGANYILNYVGEESECGQYGDIYINIVNNGTQMNLFLWPGGDLILASECPNGGATQIFPVQGEGYIALIKQ